MHQKIIAMRYNTRTAFFVLLFIVRASPSGKAPASQAGMRGFESRRPLQKRT